MAILSARWQRDDRPEYVSGRTRICNHRHRRRGGTRSSLTTPSQVQLRPEGGEQLRLSGLAAMRHSCITHGGTGYQHPRPSHRGLDLDKKAVLGQLGHREYWFAERASEHVGSVEEWEDYVGGWLSFKFPLTLSSSWTFDVHLALSPRTLAHRGAKCLLSTILTFD